jgi:hypothetical protein
MSNPATHPSWLQVHLPIVLYGWFWFGMFLCGFLAPAERVAMLESGVISEGWHLSAMSVVLGLPVVLLYIRRMRPEDADGSVHR